MMRISMMADDGFGRRLLVALADASPAFGANPESVIGGFGRRLLVALADASPAFRPLRTEEELQQGSSEPSTSTVQTPEWGSVVTKALETLESHFAELQRRDDQLMAAERVSGPEHPGTLAARSELARWTGEAGDPAAARDLFAGLVPVLERVSGPEHPGTLAARSELARWTGEAGDPAAARDLFAGLLAGRGVLGEAEQPTSSAEFLSATEPLPPDDSADAEQPTWHAELTIVKARAGMAP